MSPFSFGFFWNFSLTFISAVLKSDTVTSLKLIQKLASRGNKTIAITIATVGTSIV